MLRSFIAVLIAVVGAGCPAAGIALASQQAAQPSAAPSPSALDREFITVIRFANLWEVPMGRLAVERGTTQTMKDVGATLAEDHTKLDVAVKDLAKRLGVALPDEPTSQQQGWMAEISSKTGAEFDRAFANRLRGAHGTVFGLVANVRAGTRNEVIRAFAQQANEVVMKHMTLLESTGLVHHASQFSEASARSVNNPENSLGRSQIVFAIVLGLLTLAGTLVAVRTLSSRGSADR